MKILLEINMENELSIDELEGWRKMCETRQVQPEQAIAQLIRSTLAGEGAAK